MKHLVLAFSIAVASTEVPRAAIVITEVMSSSGHPGGTNNGDWFEVTNTGSSAVNITGWSWDDNSFTSGSSGFGSLTSIAAGQSIIISEETQGAENAFSTSWGASLAVVNLGSSGFQGLSASGDAVVIYDNLGTEVTRVTFGTATTGRSFEWDRSSNSLALSVSGENGAFVSATNGASAAGSDVGSPGVSVIPEPAAAIIAAAASLMFLGRRQRREA